MADSPTIRFPRTVVLDDLRVCVRPITPDDRERIVRGLQAMSGETAYRRFFTPTFYPSEEALRYLTEIDGEHHMALGAVDCTRDGWPGVGAARYIRLSEHSSVAEAAVVVIDAYQQRGIGSILIAALSRYAAGHGVERFRGYVLSENRGVLGYLRTLDAVTEKARDGVLQVDVPVYGDAADLPETPQAERARWAWRTVNEAPVEDCNGPAH